MTFSLEDVMGWFFDNSGGGGVWYGGTGTGAPISGSPTGGPVGDGSSYPGGGGSSSPSEPPPEGGEGEEDLYIDIQIYAPSVINVHQSTFESFMTQLDLLEYKLHLLAYGENFFLCAHDIWINPLWIYPTTDEYFSDEAIRARMTLGTSEGDNISEMGMIFGGAGSDTISGSAYGDILSGGVGDDRLSGGAGNDVYDGGEGFDTVSYENAGSGIRASLATGRGALGDASGDLFRNIDAFIGSAHDDELTGNASHNRLHGQGGDDLLSGGAGDDTLNGGAGNDTLIGGKGADTLSGGEGFDQVSYEDAVSGVQINLATGTATGGAAGDTLSSIEAVSGSTHGDWLTGNAANNSLLGNGGNDYLDGGAGNDTLSGGDGDDTLIGGAGGDVLNGGSGWDMVDYLDAQAGVVASLATGGTGGEAAGDTFSGIEFLMGSQYGDQLTGDVNDNWLAGKNGNDTLNGGSGNDVLFGGDGDDSLIGGAGADSLIGNDGFDIVSYLDFGHSGGIAEGIGQALPKGRCGFWRFVPVPGRE